MFCIICNKEFIKINVNQKCCSKECSEINNKLVHNQYKKEHKNEIKLQTEEYKKEYKKEHENEIKNYHKKYYKNNKEKLIDQHKEYQKNHKEEIKEQKKKYHENYYEENKKDLLEYQQKYQKTPKGKENNKKIRNKRQRSLGFNPLNEYLENSEAHHINNIDVIYIPINYHLRGHSVIKNKNMESINTIAFFFLLMQNINKIILLFKN